MEHFGIVILAAGQGTRLKLDIAKPLVPLRGKKLIDYALAASQGFLTHLKVSGRMGIVIGHQREALKAYLGSSKYSGHFDYAVQEKQLGTADAVRAYFKDCPWAAQTEWTLVMCADTPLISQEVLSQLWAMIDAQSCQAVAATFKTANPRGYGRIIRDGKGFKIVEEKDANETEKKINEVNSGLYFVRTKYLIDKLQGIDSNNNSGEFYLTDIFSQTESVQAICFDDERLFLGVNNLVQLAQAGEDLNRMKCQELMLSGVLVQASAGIYIEDEVNIGAGTVVGLGAYLEGETHIGRHCLIEPHVVIKNSKIEDDAQILAGSYLENSHIGVKASVGPYARLRPGTILETKVKVGNFVETKKAHLKAEAKVSHLSYVGDAEIGERSNIGCGFITCNYDGAQKHFTKIGKDCFIGSDSQMVAPVEIGDESFVACGSTITHSVAPGGFAVARSRQETKLGLAKRFLKKKEP